MAATLTAETSLHLTVITPARAVFDADAKSVVAPAFDGEIGIHIGHAAMLALLGTGELRVTTPQGDTRKLAIRGGFLQVDHNKITILTPESASPEELKPEVLAEEAQKLEGEKHTKLDERDAQEVKRAWLKARQKIKQ